jgi:hypothetical protein
MIKEKYFAFEEILDDLKEYEFREKEDYIFIGLE